MVLILQSLHSNVDHIHHQILTGQEVPSLDSLITRLLCVPTLAKREKFNQSG